MTASPRRGTLRLMSIFDAFDSRWHPGSKVVSTTACGDGILGKHVPKGTHGRVKEYREGMLSDSVRVEFDNGYTEIVKPSEITKPTWW